MKRDGIRKASVFFFCLMLLGLLGLPNPVLANSGNPNVPTPQDLADRGWVCLHIVNDSNQYAFCMPHNYDWYGGEPAPAAITNKTFLVSDDSFANPVYLGNSLYIRSDLYAGQQCLTNSDSQAYPQYMEVLGGKYYNCRRFDQPYP